MQSPFKALPEFSTEITESIVHFLAYNNYQDQVESMLELLQQHRVSVDKNPSLMFRLRLCTIFDSLNKATNTFEDLKAVLHQLDEIIAESSALEVWGEFRLTFVAQLAVALLRDKANITADSINPQGLKSLKAKQWALEVKSLFEQEGYTIDADQFEEGVTDLELKKEFESLIDIGSPTDKVHVAYILKRYPWTEFIFKVKSALQQVQEEVCGLPDLMLSASTGSESNELMDAIQEEDGGDMEEPEEIVPKAKHSRSSSSSSAYQANNAKPHGSSLSRLTSQLTNNTDHGVLEDALADTSPTSRTVMGARARHASSPSKRGGANPLASFIGTRPSSKPIAFTEEDEDDLEEEEAPSLPKNAVVPLATLPHMRFATSTSTGTRFSNTKASSSTIPRETKDKKRKRTAWTSQEEEWIAQGVSQFGIGRWAEIRDAFFQGTGRTSVHIKDKYRNMCH